MPSPEAWARIRADYEHTERPVGEICAEHGISPGTLRDRMRRWNWTRRRQPISAEGPPPLPAPRFAAAPSADSSVVIPHPPPPPRVQPPLIAPPQVDGADEVLDLTAAFGGVDAAPAPLAPAAASFAPVPAEPAQVAQRLQGAVARVLPAIEATLGKLAAHASQPREMESAGRALSSLTRTLRELNALLAQYPAPAADDGPNTLDEFRAELLRKMDNISAQYAAEKAADAAAAQAAEN